VTPPDEFEMASAALPSASQNQRDFDSPILIARKGETALLAALLCPVFAVDPMGWAVCRRTFEIIRDSIRIGETEKDA